MLRMSAIVRKGDLNYSITLTARNLFILHSASRPKCPTIPLPLYVYCTANALPLYGERTAEEKTFSLPNNSLTSAPPIGQGHRCKSASHCGSRFVKPLSGSGGQVEKVFEK